MRNVYIGVYNDDESLAYHATFAKNRKEAEEHLKAKEKPAAYYTGKTLLGFHRVKVTKEQDADSLLREQWPQLVEDYELKVELPF